MADNEHQDDVPEFKPGGLPGVNGPVEVILRDEEVIVQMKILFPEEGY